MKKICSSSAFGIAFVTIFLLVTGHYSYGSDVVETVNVEGQIYSDELLESKNMVIITDADLDQMKVNNLADLFSFFTAVNVSKRGPLETSYDLTMRGSNFEQVLVLIDGVPLNNPQTGHFNTDFPFTVNDIGRVEILRGGSSTAYGAGAFAGVINIILKKENTLHLTATSGENKFFSTSLGVGKKIKNTALRFSVDRTNSSGFHEGREFDRLKLTVGAFYSRENMEIDFRCGYLHKDFGAEGFYAPFPSTEKIHSFFARFGLTHSFKRFTYSLVYSFNSHDDDFVLDRNRPGYFSSSSLTNLHYFKLSTGYTVKWFTALVGADFQRETMDSTSMGVRKRNRGALFLNINLTLDNFLGKKGGFDAGIRRNFVGNGQSALTYYSGLYRYMGDSVIIRTGYGKSFRMPSFTERYYLSPGNVGSEDLQPEISHNFETSFTFFKARYNLDLSVFYRKETNTIDWVKYPGLLPWYAVNIEKNDIFGVELTQRFLFNQTRVIVGLERLIAVNKHEVEEVVESKYGLRFPDFSVKLNVMQPVTNWLKVTANYNYKQIYNTDENGHFLNLVVTVPIKKLELSLRCDNAFNTIIQEIPGVDAPGRWIYVTVAYKH